MRKHVLLPLLSLPFLLSGPALAKQPCISNLSPNQGGLSMQTFRSHSAKLGGPQGQPECATNGKDKELKALKEYLQGLHVIGMPGYNNENPPHNYMASLERFVKANGGTFVPLVSHSDRIIEVDARRKCQLFRNVGGQRVVMIGHSKGGATALAMWAHCPELMSQFEAVILVQAVIQGTNAADMAVNANAASKKAAELITKYEWLAKAVGPASGGASMTTAAARERLNSIRGKVNPAKVICVRSHAPSSQLDNRMLSVEYAEKAFGSTPNDGLVEFNNQYSSIACGHDIQLNGVHHKALIERDSVDPSDNPAREAFAAFLLNKARQITGRR